MSKASVHDADVTGLVSSREDAVTGGGAFLLSAFLRRDAPTDNLLLPNL